MFDRHRAFPITVASNSGHHVLLDATKAHESARLHFPLNDPEAETHFMTTMRGISSVIESVHTSFNTHYPSEKVQKGLHQVRVNGHATALFETRERCGAIIYEGVTDGEVKDIHAMFNESVAALPSNVGKQVLYAAKNVVIGENKNNGYIDIKPNGMSKGASIKALLARPEFARVITPKTHFLLPGDSAPDIETMTAVSQMFGKTNAITNVWVGDDPAAAKYVQSNNITIENIPGEQYTAVDGMYNVLESAAWAPNGRERMRHNSKKTQGIEVHRLVAAQ